MPPDFSGQNLRGRSFKGLNLEGANFSGADIHSTDFTGANLRGANFSHADLSHADLSHANLREVNFGNADLSAAYLRNADCTGADLDSARLTSAYFGNALLCRANLHNASFYDLGTNMSLRSFSVEPKLLSADFSGADLTGLDLSRVDLLGVKFFQAKLSRANLSWANLSETNLSQADLSEANLSSANLFRADLGEAVLHRVNLCNANLITTQAVDADFMGAILTGACIENWNINENTKLDGVLCDYIYMKANHQERRPSSGKFALREFTRLFQKTLETVDLIFRNGIDWNAFAYSFKKVEIENQGAKLDVQSIEKKGDGILLVRVAVSPNADKEKIHDTFMQGYEFAHNVLEGQYQARIEDKDKIINQLFSAINQQNKQLAETSGKVTIYYQPDTQFAGGIVDAGTVNANENNSMVDNSNKQSNFDLKGAQFGGGLVNADTVNAEQIGGDITNYGQQQQKEAQTETNNSAVKTILILASNPKNTSQLRLDQEVREIDAGLQRAKKRELFDLKQRWAVRVQDVYQALLDFKPQVVHFSGHGSGDDGIALEDDTGNLKLVDTEALAKLFELFSTTIECIVLNACYSEVQAQAIAKHIPYVIGMNKAIGDKAAIKFATGFYSTLGAGESVEFAYKLGCNVIQLDGIPEHLTPILQNKQ